MKIYKRLDECMDDMVRIGDIVDVCKKAEGCSRELSKRALDSASKGDYSLLSAIVFFNREEMLYKHIIPDILLQIINRPLQ